MNDSEFQHELMRCAIPPGHGQVTCTSPKFLEGGAMAGDVSPTEPFVPENDSVLPCQQQSSSTTSTCDLQLGGMPPRYHPFYFVWDIMDAGDDCLPSQGMPYEIAFCDLSSSDQVGLLVAPENLTVREVADHLWHLARLSVYGRAASCDKEIRHYEGDLFVDTHLLNEPFVWEDLHQYADDAHLELELLSVPHDGYPDGDLIQAGAVAEDDLVAMSVKLRSMGTGYTQGQIKMILARDAKALKKLQNTDSPSALYDIMVASGKRADVNPKACSVPTKGGERG